MSEPTSNAVLVKLPTFWTAGPEAWFAQAEAQFAIRQITQDDTKYLFHVVAALDNTTATRALSILTNPPQNNKYLTLKEFLTGAYSLSNAERASALLDFQPGTLGDRKPNGFHVGSTGHKQTMFPFPPSFPPPAT